MKVQLPHGSALDRSVSRINKTRSTRSTPGRVTVAGSRSMHQTHKCEAGVSVISGQVMTRASGAQGGVHRPMDVLQQFRPNPLAKVGFSLGRVA